LDPHRLQVERHDQQAYQRLVAEELRWHRSGCATCGIWTNWWRSRGATPYNNHIHTDTSSKMTDQQQITDAFMRDFEDLLRRYNATFEVTEISTGILNTIPSAEIDFDVIYDENHNEVRPYINFRLPNYINSLYAD
jgi:hypothetical protein